MSKRLALKDMENTRLADRNIELTSNDELYHEISVCLMLHFVLWIIHQIVVLCIVLSSKVILSSFLFFQQIQEDIQHKELFLEKINVRMTMVVEKANDLTKSFETVCGMKNFLQSLKFFHFKSTRSVCHLTMFMLRHMMPVLFLCVCVHACAFLTVICVC